MHVRGRRNRAPRSGTKWLVRLDGDSTLCARRWIATAFSYVMRSGLSLRRGLTGLAHARAAVWCVVRTSTGWTETQGSTHGMYCRCACVPDSRNGCADSELGSFMVGRIVCPHVLWASVLLVHARWAPLIGRPNRTGVWVRSGSVDAGLPVRSAVCVGLAHSLEAWTWTWTWTQTRIWICNRTDSYQDDFGRLSLPLKQAMLCAYIELYLQ